MNIVLTGFMGTGKTTVGRVLAQKMKLKYRDLDSQVIENFEGKSVAEIFEKHGEPAFRRIEKAAIEEVSLLDNQVISAGGGAILNPENRKNLEKKGILVCLTAKSGTILERLKGDLTRPLLAGENKEEKIERLIKEREAIYSICPVQVETDNKTIDQVAEEIIQKVSSKWGN